MLEKQLRAILRVRLDRLPVYKTLMARLNEIIDLKNQETRDTLERLKDLTGELNKAIKQEEAMDQSRGEMSIRQLVAEKVVQYGQANELASKITDCISEKVFPGWQSQSTVRAGIKRDIILELARYAQTHPEVELNPDDYSKFSREAMKYVEKHF